ncbi:hypothetical protein [Streptomyces sp. NPDC006147]|uniref:hypothetical protein n=1 Tax=unclassified Streptomyces TaxID=2593676 RepID=UPI0033BCD1FA
MTKPEVSGLPLRWSPRPKAAFTDWESMMVVTARDPFAHIAADASGEVVSAYT